MGGSLNQPCRVRVKALRVNNLFDTGAIRSASRTDESTVRTSVG